MDDIIVEFVHEWKGFNNLTRWAWRWLLDAKVVDYCSFMPMCTMINPVRLAYRSFHKDSRLRQYSIVLIIFL